MVVTYSPVADKPADTNFARFLWAVMQRRCVSQRQIAANTGLSASAIGDWIFKGVLPKEESIAKLAPWLHMDFEELWRVVRGDLAAETAAQMQLSSTQMQIETESLLRQIEEWMRRWGRHVPPDPDQS